MKGKYIITKWKDGVDLESKEEEYSMKANSKIIIFMALEGIMIRMERFILVILLKDSNKVLEHVIVILIIMKISF